MPANFTHVIDHAIADMRRLGLESYSASDGEHVYRVGLLGSSVQIQITHTPKARPAIPSGIGSVDHLLGNA